MSEKKMVRRSVAVALGIVCIILVAGLGVMAYVSYSPTSGSSNAALQAKIDQLQGWLDGNKTLLNHTQTWLEGNITSYDSQITSLNSQITTLTNERNQLQTWLDGNITAYNNYVNDHSYTNEQYQILQNQISDLQSGIASLNSTYNSYVSDHSYTNEQYQTLLNQIANLQAPNLIKVNLKSDDNHPWPIGQEYLHVYGEICNVGFNTAYNSKLHVVGYQSGGVVAFDTYILLGTISGYSWTSVDGSIPYNGGALTSWTITPQWTSS